MCQRSSYSRIFAPRLVQAFYNFVTDEAYLKVCFPEIVQSSQGSCHIRYITFYRSTQMKKTHYKPVTEDKDKALLNTVIYLIAIALVGVFIWLH